MSLEKPNINCPFNPTLGKGTQEERGGGAEKARGRGEAAPGEGRDREERGSQADEGAAGRGDPR